MRVKVFKLHLVPDNEHIKAIACITVGDIAINDIRIVSHDGRLLVMMPSRPDNVGKLRDTAHPTTHALRAQVEHMVLEAYKQAVNDNMEE